MKEIIEVWKDIEGYEGIYQVSNTGRVKSFKYNKEKILKLINDTNGYIIIHLHNNKHRIKLGVHRLVGKAFITNPENKPEINHKDGDKTNNNVWNLEWNTYKENTNHAFKIGLCKSLKGIDRHNSKLTEVQVLEIRKLYSLGNYIQKDLGELFNVDQSVISEIINNKIWKHIT